MAQQAYVLGIARRSVRRCIIPAILLLGSSRVVAAQAQDTDDPPSRVARISAADGTVSLQASGATDWSAATLNYSMTTGDRLFTDAGSRAELEIGPFSVRMADSTDLTLTNLTDHLAQLGIAQGVLRLSVYRLAPDDTVEIDTPNGALTIRAPGHYRVVVPADGDYSLLTVDDGAVDTYGPGLAQTVRGPQTVRLTGTNPIDIATAPTPPATSFDSWSAERDGQLASAGCGQYMSADIPGCADLRQYGRWANTPSYGVVWYPPPGAPGWAPYRFGHWVWVEPWGWVWVDDAPWGFAPFHYGRWALIGAAWAWVPGPIMAPCYSPALVVFAGGGGIGIGIQAWFPLGPRDPFIPWYHYGPSYLRTVNAANVRGVRDINGFVNVTNVSQIRYAHRIDGFTAVSSQTFSDGHRVDGALVRVGAADIGRAQPVSHPNVMPTGRAASGGAPAVRAPTVRRAPMVQGAPPVQQAPRGAQPARGGQARPPITRAAPPPVTRAAPPPPARGAQAAAGQTPRSVPRPIITKRPAPPQNPPFTDRANVMKANPGRPLNPQQMKKLRQAAPTKAPPTKAAPPPKKKGGGG